MRKRSCQSNFHIGNAFCQLMRRDGGQVLEHCGTASATCPAAGRGKVGHDAVGNRYIVVGISTVISAEGCTTGVGSKSNGVAQRKVNHVKRIHVTAAIELRIREIMCGDLRLKFGDDLAIIYSSTSYRWSDCVRANDGAATNGLIAAWQTISKTG